MRKIIMFNLVSLDGFYAGVDGNIDWHVVDDEFNEYAVESIREFGGILFGRKTYELFKNYWPGELQDPKTAPADKIIAKVIDDLPKYVISHAAPDTGWNNSHALKGLDEDSIMELKKQPGKDIVIYGSGTVVQQLTDLRLIDEYRILVNPIILGEGKQLFHNVQQTKLQSIGMQSFRSGNVLLIYKLA